VKLFQAALPKEFFERQREKAGKPPEKGIYTAAVVVMLMILQRLLPGKLALSAVVQQVGGGTLKRVLPAHKRIANGTVSPNNGAFSRARCRLPKAVVETAADEIVQYLLAGHKEALPGLGRQLFLLDGSSIDMPHTLELLQAYPPASGRYGDSHWAMMRVLVAHDLVSGIAVRPAYGPMYGSNAISEQALTEQIIFRLPDGSVIVCDRNFGVFSVNWCAHQKNHPIVTRMTDSRARALNGGKLPSKADLWVDWKPSRCDRRAHPLLPANACIRVRFIATQVVRQGQTIQLYLVTTLDLPVEQIVQLYGYRWHIELDLRSLKQTVQLHSLRSTTVDMAEKELILGVTAYNFVRAAIWVAAQAADMDPRQISFSRAQQVVDASLPLLQAARSKREYAEVLQRMLRNIARCKLPQEKLRKGYPRATWPRGSTFPKQKPKTSTNA
jgi:putative transposase